MHHTTVAYATDEWGGVASTRGMNVSGQKTAFDLGHVTATI